MDHKEYFAQRNIDPQLMEEAREKIDRHIEAYRLKEARRQCGVTQEQLAQRLGVSQKRVSALEHGDLSRLKVDTVRRYVQGLGGRLTLVLEVPVPDQAAPGQANPGEPAMIRVEL